MAADPALPAPQHHGHMYSRNGSHRLLPAILLPIQGSFCRCRCRCHCHCRSHCHRRCLVEWFHSSGTSAFRPAAAVAGGGRAAAGGMPRERVLAAAARHSQHNTRGGPCTCTGPARRAAEAPPPLQRGPCPQPQPEQSLSFPASGLAPSAGKARGECQLLTICFRRRQRQSRWLDGLRNHLSLQSGLLTS